MRSEVYNRSRLNAIPVPGGCANDYNRKVSEEKPMQLNIELTSEYESKLFYVQQRTELKDLKATIEAAIDAYYNQLEPIQKTALEIFRDSGFIGCAQGDENLSTNYKSVVNAAIQERFNQSQDL